MKALFDSNSKISFYHDEEIIFSLYGCICRIYQ